MLARRWHGTVVNGVRLWKHDRSHSGGIMTFELPPLPYAKDALAPHLSAETLEYHYGKHHKTYVDQPQQADRGQAEDANASLEEIIMSSDGGVFNNAAQVWNHTFYWNSHEARAAAAPPAERPATLDHARLRRRTSQFRDEFEDGRDRPVRLRLGVARRRRRQARGHEDRERRPAAEARQDGARSPATCGSTPTTSTTATPARSTSTTFLDTCSTGSFGGRPNLAR